MSMRLLFLLLACSAAGYLSFARDAQPPPPPLQPQAGAPFIPASIAPLPEPSAGPWPEQVARPLFSPERRLPQAAAAPPVPRTSPEPPPPLAATGVALRPGGALALLKLADDRIVRVAVGDEVDGWQVARISGDGVHLTRGRRSLTLTARVASADGLARVE